MALAPSKSLEPRVRRVLRPGDLGRIVAHHGRVYGPEYGVDQTFEADVAVAVARAGGRGFPTSREAIWIVETGAGHAGSVAITDEGNDQAALRWFVLDAALRGHGLGRRLLDEALASAERLGYMRLWLDTFSELVAAARLYRAHGFTLVSEDIGPRWGRDEINYQRYELELPRAGEARERGLAEKSPSAARAARASA